MIHYLQDQDPQARPVCIDSSEILDEIITRSRGEIRRSCSPRVTSSTPTSLGEIRSTHSPQLAQRAYSPRINVLRGERSPRLNGAGLEIKQTPSPPQPSKLGQNGRGTSSST